MVRSETWTVVFHSFKYTQWVLFQADDVHCVMGRVGGYLDKCLSVLKGLGIHKALVNIDPTIPGEALVKTDDIVPGKKSGHQWRQWSLL